MGLVALLFHGPQSRANDLAAEVIALPPLLIHGNPARAHVQGMDRVDDTFYVTARRDDVQPKRALLLRTRARGAGWDVWDITPLSAENTLTELDHPGGMQSDGKRLWIPLAASKRNGRSIIRAFLLTDLETRRPLKPVSEYAVDDHIGAVAVSTETGLIYGANWDTEKVYVWDRQGRLKKVLSGDELKLRGLGLMDGAERRPGIAVQDWKVVGHRLYASGLFRSVASDPSTSSGQAPASPRSRLCWFERFLERDFRRWTIVIPPREGIELAHEAMAISDGAVYFLPEDLGATNRMFRIALDGLEKRAVAESAR